jgi:hypothetical protein
MFSRLLRRWLLRPGAAGTPRKPAPGRACRSFRPTVEVLEGLDLASGGPLPLSGLAALGLERLQDHGIIINHTGYNYAPTVLFDGHKYRMWWTGEGGSSPGDHILYSQARSLAGPWSTPVVVFGPGSSFASVHTADPSVVQYNGLFYLYYSGSSSAALVPAAPTEIGAAVSRDGTHWMPLNGGRPIVLPHQSTAVVPNKYGVGQPSVFEGPDGELYMLYTDTTGAASNPTTGAGIYVIRSFDPTFQTGVEELSVPGPGAAPQFVPRDNSQQRFGNFATNFALLDATSVDGLFVPALNAFAVVMFEDLNPAFGPSGPAAVVSVFDSSFQHLEQTLVIPGVTFTEGPGIVRTPQGQALSFFGPGLLPLDLVRSVGLQLSSDPLDPSRAARVNTWKLAWEQILLQD